MIALASLLLGVAGTIAVTGQKFGRDQQVLADTQRRSKANTDRITALETAVAELPYIRRDVDAIRKLLEREVQP